MVAYQVAAVLCRITFSRTSKMCTFIETLILLVAVEMNMETELPI